MYLTFILVTHNTCKFLSCFVIGVRFLNDCGQAVGFSLAQSSAIWSGQPDWVSSSPGQNIITVCFWSRASKNRSNLKMDGIVAASSSTAPASFDRSDFPSDWLTVEGVLWMSCVLVVGSGIDLSACKTNNLHSTHARWHTWFGSVLANAVYVCIICPSFGAWQPFNLAEHI